MKYIGNEIPSISKFYTYRNDEINNRVVCSSLGHLKVLNCDPKVLEKFLSYINGKNTFNDIENIFINKYSKEDIEIFIDTLLYENVIEKSKMEYINSKPKILIIGDGFVSNFFDIESSVSINDFLVKDLSICFDIAVFAPSECTYADALKLNKKMFKLNKPFIQIFYTGSNISVGPLFVPNKTACIECVVSSKIYKLNLKISDDQKIGIDELEYIKYSHHLPKEHDSSLLVYIAQTICKDISNFFNNKESIFLDCEYLVDSDFLSSKLESRLPNTSCSLCKAINKNYTIFRSDFLIEDYLNNNYEDLINIGYKYSLGGIRSKTEEETRKLLDIELQRLGAKIKIEPAIGNPFSNIGAASCYHASVEQTWRNEDSFITRNNSAHGKGFTKTQSFFSAAFELFEHMGLQYTGDTPILCAKYDDIKKFAVDLPSIDRKIINKLTAFEDFDGNKEMDWVVASSLTLDERKLVPAFQVFLNGIDVKGELYRPTSNGAAAALTIEDAILHGLLEIVERDAWLIGQCNPYILPLVDYETYASKSNQKLYDIIQKIRGMGYDLIIRDYTTDIGIPVFRTWIVNRNNYSQYAYSGFGCHVCPVIALERSVSEAIQVNDAHFYAGEMDLDVFTNDFLIKNPFSLYNQHHLTTKDILGKTDKITTIGSPIFDIKSSYEILKNVSALIKNKVGGDVYYVDMTKPNSNIKVVRVIATGDIQQMHDPLIMLSERMFEFGIRCGYDNKRTIYEELFLGSYQG